MTRRLLIGFTALAIVLLVAWFAPAQEPATTAKVRIGVYDSRAVCVASRGTPAFSQQIADLQKQMDAAKAAGDIKRIEQLKHRGESLQKLRHLQAFSKAPIGDILAQIKDQLPAIAKQANVSAIVGTLDYTGPDAQAVDVTDKLVKAFHPDENTLKTVAELRKHSPIDLVDALQIPD